MRPSQKIAILDAAVRLAERSGITSITLEAAAQEAGLSKGGLIYHFATKEQLIREVVEHIVRAWDELMRARLDRPFEQATRAERILAYARVSAEAPARRADLAVLVDSVRDEQLLAPWRAMISDWLGEPGLSDVDTVVARLAADGLWLAEATDTAGIDAGTREAAVARIYELAGERSR